MRKPHLVLVVVQAHHQNHQEPESTVVLLANPADRRQIWMLRKPKFYKMISMAEKERRLLKRYVNKHITKQILFGPSKWSDYS